MDIMFVGPAEECRQVKIALISTIRYIMDIQNVQPGGEGIAERKANICSCYFALAPGGHGVGLRAAFDRRAREVP